FQAEDGIRDFHVTGVQTCALPIFLAASLSISSICSAVSSVSVAFIIKHLSRFLLKVACPSTNALYVILKKSLQDKPAFSDLAKTGITVPVLEESTISFNREFEFDLKTFKFVKPFPSIEIAPQFRK